MTPVCLSSLVMAPGQEDTLFVKGGGLGGREEGGAGMRRLSALPPQINVT